jgi:hypothetical protein
MSGNRENISGMKFGRLTVDGYYGSKNGAAYWTCKCDCGEITIVRTCKLKGGQTKSCGCLRFAGVNRRHGMKNTAEYRIWIHIKRRCQNPNMACWADYGGRGISVCSDWNASFEAFYRDMGPLPGHGYSIDRIDVNGNYEPSNCRWANSHQQNNNRRNNRLVVYKGETMPLGIAVESAGFVVDIEIARSRLNRGWTADDAVELKPVRSIVVGGKYTSPRKAPMVGAE